MSVENSGFRFRPRLYRNSPLTLGSAQFLTDPPKSAAWAACSLTSRRQEPTLFIDRAMLYL